MIFFYCLSPQTKRHQESSDLNAFDKLSLVCSFCCLKTGYLDDIYLFKIDLDLVSAICGLCIHKLKGSKLTPLKGNQHNILKCPPFLTATPQVWFDCCISNDHQGCTTLPTQLPLYSWLSVKWTCINPAFCLHTSFITLRGLSLMFNM